MRSILAAAALAASFAVSAGDLVLTNKDSGQELRLYERVCSHAGTVGLIAENWRDKFKDAKIRKTDGTVLWYGCWIEQNGNAYVIFEDGDTLAFPLSAFKDPSV